MKAAEASSLSLLLLVVAWVVAGSASAPWRDGPVQCSLGGRANCTVTNAYGSFNDGEPCRAAKAVYPRTEAEVVAAVARAVRERRKVKVATRQSHSFPKLACPGGRGGTVVSTALLDRVVRVDAGRRQVTVEGGVTLRELVDAAAAAGLALPNSPYFSGVTVGGLLATGAHGSSLWGKGGAVHEYVVGMRIVTPAPPAERRRGRFAVVRELRAGDPDLDAAKVSLGVLGVVSQVTLQLEPQFKRSMTFVRNDSDADLAELVAAWGHRYEFGDLWWLPGHGKVILRKDDRVDVSTPGDGVNTAFRPKRTSDIIQERLQEEQRQEAGSDDALCGASTTLSQVDHGFDYTNYGDSFTGYPVVGYQHRIQASSSCVANMEAGDRAETCPWDPRIHGSFNYILALIVPLSNATSLIDDALRLRDRNPDAFCDLDVYNGVLLRYIKGSTAYLGAPEDAVELDIAYYRSRAPGRTARHADVFDELEQLALYKYNALPHWGKSRDYSFNDTGGRYPKLRAFLEVKERFDPDGVFSSEWSDHVLGIGGPATARPGCAVQGLCACTQDSHCAPGYVCSSGQVYPDARVCTVSSKRQQG